MFGKKRSELTEQDVLNALKGVKDPDLHRDLVDLGMVRNIQIGDGTIALMVNLTTPACPMKAQIERDVRDRPERAAWAPTGPTRSPWGPRSGARESPRRATFPASRT